MRRSLIAFLFFNAQEYAIWLAITLYAYARGGATTAGIVAVAQLVPAALFAPLGAVLGDSMRRDRALGTSYAIQGIAALACGIALAVAPPLVVYGTAIVSACAITLTRPVHFAILPQLAASPEELAAGNSLSSTVEGMGIFAGPMLNSVLIAVRGPSAVCLAFAALMLLAAALTHRLELLDRGGDADEAHEPRATEGVLTKASAAARELRHDPPAAVLTLFGGAQWFVLGVLDIFYALLAIDVLDIGESGAGLLAASVGVGGLLGATGTAVLVGRTRLAAPIELAVGVAGGAIAAVSLASALGPVLLLLMAAGAARAFFDVAARTLLQRSVRREILARVFGLQEALLMLGLAAGSAVAPVLISRFGSGGAFAATGLVLALAGLLTLPSLRVLDRRSTVPDPQRLALMRSIVMFGVLPPAALEHVTSSLAELDVQAGHRIITEGAHGDRFYIVLEGEAVVSMGGREVSRPKRGDYFGEIALLRDVPRTATVVAVTDMSLLTLEREDFLAAVTVSRSSVEAADAEIERRLSDGRP